MKKIALCTTVLLLIFTTHIYAKSDEKLDDEVFEVAKERLYNNHNKRLKNLKESTKCIETVKNKEELKQCLKREKEFFETLMQEDTKKE